MVVEQLNGSMSKEHDNFRDSDWGPQAAGAMADAARDFPIVNGGKSGMTMGDLIDRTNKDMISKVVLEEKVYKTWFGSRTVLLGDGKDQRSMIANGISIINIQKKLIPVFFFVLYNFHLLWISLSQGKLCKLLT